MILITAALPGVDVNHRLRFLYRTLLLPSPLSSWIRYKMAEHFSEHVSAYILHFLYMLYYTDHCFYSDTTYLRKGLNISFSLYSTSRPGKIQNNKAQRIFGPQSFCKTVRYQEKLNMLCSPIVNNIAF